MPYITKRISPRTKQMTIDDIFNDTSEDAFAPRKDTHNTVTRFYDKVPYRYENFETLPDMCATLFDFNRRYAELESVEDKSTLYRSFKIPKRSGGLRPIDAPLPELMDALRDFKTILENKFFASYHTAAFAYVPGRSTIDAVKRHQENKSRWFLKTDFSKFFPSTTKEFLIGMLYQTFPFCVLKSYDRFDEEFRKAIDLCFLNGGLPQGTPTSPMLTNMMMIPIDHAIGQYCRTHNPTICYTRYADDAIFSSRYDFEFKEVVNAVDAILSDFKSPFRFNQMKTRYGSSAGRNWNLGVMLNKDNEITIGHEKKKVAKAMAFQFGADYKSGNKWSLEDTQHFAGLMSYYRMVEPDFVTGLFKTYTEKFGFDIESAIKEILAS